MKIQEFFDPTTFTLTYLVWDEKSRDAVVIDPVLDYDPASSKVSESLLRHVMALIEAQDLKVHFLLETHAHADHLSGSQHLKARYPQAQVAIGATITEVQKIFKPIFDLPETFPTDGRQFDRLLKDNEVVGAGSLQFEVRSTPGHTPACSSYLFGDAVFTGDALFMPDYGVGRCDFPAGSAERLYDSVTRRLYSLPDSTRVFTGHDYLPNGRPLRFQSTIGEEKSLNIHLNARTTQAEFIAFRTARDKTLSAPKLLLPSVQINIDAGNLPGSRKNGVRYLSIPLYEEV